MDRRIPAALLCAAVLAGCASFPELDAAVTPEARKADYPTLVPVDTILVRRADARVTEATTTGLLARAANLNARARLLRGAVVDEDTRLRLAARLARLGG